MAVLRCMTLQVSSCAQLQFATGTGECGVGLDGDGPRLGMPDAQQVPQLPPGALKVPAEAGASCVCSCRMLTIVTGQCLSARRTDARNTKEVCCL